MMKILFLGDPADVSDTLVARCLDSRGVHVVRPDFTTLATETSIQVISNDHHARVAAAFGHVNADVIWYRSLQVPSMISEIDDPVERLYVEDAWTTTILGTLESERAVWVNPFYAQASASNKVTQLHEAVAFGLSIPKTLITSSPHAAAKFMAETPYGICKGVHNHSRGISTLTIAFEDIPSQSLDALPLCPAIFQERVPVRKNIRIIFCGDVHFGFEAEDAGVDWRTTSSLEWSNHELPAHLSDKLRRMLRQRSLTFAAVDMILTPEGSYMFLEINPGGNFLFLELWTEIGIPQHIAEMLINAGRSGGSR